MKDTWKDFSERFAWKIKEIQIPEKPKNDNKIWNVEYFTKSEVILLLPLKK